MTHIDVYMQASQQEVFKQAIDEMRQSFIEQQKKLTLAKSALEKIQKSNPPLLISEIVTDTLLLIK